MIKYTLKHLFATLLLLCSITANAHDFEVDGIFYNITDTVAKTVEVTYKGEYISIYDEYYGSVVIPENVTYDGNTYSVTRIGSSAFYNSTTLHSITIPSSITAIGNDNPSFPVFGDCYALKEVHITDLSAWCKIDFDGSSSNPLWYDGVLFLNGEKVTDLVIPNDVTGIKKYAFYNCKDLKTIYITKSINKIESWAFANCGNVESIVVDEANTIYDSREGCNAIIETETSNLLIGCKNTTIPNSITNIGEYAFYKCSGLTSINIPDGITTIKDYTFSGCSSLANVNIPKSLTSIERRAFSGCSSLVSVNIPQNLTSIEDDAFSGCHNLDKVDISDLAAWCKIDFSTISSNPLNNKGSLLLNGEKITNLIIPGNITEIKKYAFYNCQGLVDITTGNNVTDIGSYAFGNCTTLANIKITGSVKNIDAYAFDYCSTITNITIDESNSVYDSRENCNAIIETSTNKLIRGCESTIIPNSVTHIADYSFGQCIGLKKLTIPSNITQIGSSAFIGCKNLTEIISHIPAENLFRISSSQFMSGVQMKYPILYVPNDALTKYKSTDGWKNFTEIKGFYPTMSGKCGDDIEWILEYNTLTISGKGAIYDYNSSNNKAPWYDYRTVIENVIIDHGITEIGSYTFYNCEKLANIAMPSSLTDIGSYVFGYCDFTRIDIPDCVNSIGDNAFQSCYKATSVHIPGSVTNIGNNVFKGCENIEKIMVDENNATYDSREECNAIIETATNTLVVGCKNSTIPNSVTSIGVSAFEGCTGLLKIEIPRSVTEIGNRAFYNCRNLSDMTIPNGVKSIGTYAFYNCRALPDVTIPGGTTKIEDYAFYNCIGLTSITISGKETSVGNYVFSNCNAIKEIYSKSKIPVTIQYSTFTNYTATLYVPTGSKATYQATYYWKKFTNIVEMDFTVAGDIDGDDTVDVADVTTLITMILDNATDNNRADIDNDGTLDVADITALVDIILQGE